MAARLVTLRHSCAQCAITFCLRTCACALMHDDTSAPFIAVDRLRELWGPDSLDVLNVQDQFLQAGGGEVTAASRQAEHQQADARTVDSLRASRTACRLDRSSWPSMRKSKGSLVSAPEEQDH